MSSYSSRYTAAILWVLLSTALWTLIFAAAKFADGSMGTFQITLLRYIGALLTALMLARATGGLAAHRSTRTGSHFVRAVCGSGAAVAVTWSSAHMLLADATALSMTYGVMLVLLGVVFLGERPGYLMLWGSALSLGGAAVVMVGKGAFQGVLPLGPALIAVVGAVLMAVEGLLIRVLGQTERPLTVILHVCFFGLCLMLVPALLNWQPASIYAMLLCVGLGPLAILAQYCTIRGYRSAPLSVVGPVDYSWLIFAALLGFFAFGESLGTATLIGCALIVGGGVTLSRARHT
ncbi:MAG: DMT family transporter [Pararhodobacter sp.]|nr:DMT family transporter [Pararhodobacter sp.]